APPHMDSLRVVQLLTDVAYLLLGIAAITAAIRSHERARFDVALLFGSLAVAVVIQEIPLLSCPTSGCVEVPIAAQLTVVAVLVLPYALLRLIDDIADVPPWQMWLSLVLLVGLSAVVGISGTTPAGWILLVLAVYLVLGTAYAAWAFVQRARRVTGITRRRMAAGAWGCCLLAATFVLGFAGQAPQASALAPIGRITALLSGLCFWAGFFPPGWLSRAWRV